MAGFHHVINRGVEKRNVFLNEEDFDTFLDLLCKTCLEYGVNVHSYALMSNHYHLLVETSKENLSMYMRRLNAAYAIYFNKKYKRSGHLWQGRFKSWFVTDDSYLYTLIRYIEYNPLKARLIKKTGEYPYSSAQYFVGTPRKRMPSCLKASIMLEDLASDEERREFFQSGIDERVLDEMQKASALVVMNEKPKTDDRQRLQQLFKKADTKPQRNARILEAYESGISQHKIASFLGLSQPTVHGIIKREKKQ
jgi:REP element-mobilizing transposase RayT